MWYNVIVRKIEFVQDEYYHLLNRGNNKQVTFLDERDYARFLFSILYLQVPLDFENIAHEITYFIKHRTFNLSIDTGKNRLVRLLNFCLMPNHFHLTVEEVAEAGISRYMQRVLNAYTKYFNTKYERVGHLFQGPFKAISIVDDDQLEYLSAYIHRNPREITGWKDNEEKYEWSSYQDYIGKNRWGNLLDIGPVLSNFKSPADYENFIKKSGAKEQEYIEEHLF